MTLPQCVLLLHGLGRFASSMRKLENNLQRAGFAAVNVCYPSTRHPIETLADHLALPVTHPFMMNNRRVIEQTIYFLKNGKFKR